MEFAEIFCSSDLAPINLSYNFGKTKNQHSPNYSLDNLRNSKENYIEQVR